MSLPHKVASGLGKCTMKHCIVTPDIIGPVNNGGIGTHCNWFARLLAEVGRQVTVLYTGPIIHGSEGKWRDFYAQWGVEFVWLDNAVTRHYPVRAFELQTRSLDVYRYLQQRRFDVIHFQEWQGNGLQTLQARRTLGAFEGACITVTAHSNTRWIAEGGNHWYKQPLQNAMTNWAEAFMAEHADVLFSPSQYMIDWLRQKGWKLSADVRIIPVCSDQRTVPTVPIMPESGVLAFFGRLETRKGLELFLKAIACLGDADKARIRKIHFVGRDGKIRQESAQAVIGRQMSANNISFEIHDDFSSAQAIAFLEQCKPTVFVPSLSDNYPLVVVEAVSHGLPVHASRVGGIPEILGEAHLFDPTPAALSQSIAMVLQGAPPPFEFHYDASTVKEQWIAAIAECEKKTQSGVQAKSSDTFQPLVSICVPYYNYPDYLPKLLDSLRALQYPNFEVIVVDDGSSDPRARDVFDRIAKLPYDFPCRFERQGNAGVGAARNAAAQLAKGDYLVFMDADNLAKPEMLRVFMSALQRTGADVAVCYFDAFDERCEPSHEADIRYVYAPAGPCLDVAWAENVLGDANFCVSRAVFQQQGGFGSERDSSWEDWEFLLRAKLAGKAIDVVPQSLFWYRYTDAGFSRNTDKFKNQRRILKPFLDIAGRELSPVVETMMQAALSQQKDGARTPAGAIAAKIADSIYIKLGSPEGRIARAVERFFKRLIDKS